MIEWFKLDELGEEERVLSMAQELIEAYHEHLLDARIGFIFRSEASRSGDKVVIGKAMKVSARQKVHIDLDFIIWLAFDIWDDMSMEQRRALIDHELCHCQFIDGQASMRGHDIEEFNCILERHGLWKSDLITAAPSWEKAASQPPLPGIGRRGGVVTVKQFALMPTEAEAQEV